MGSFQAFLPFKDCAALIEDEDVRARVVGYYGRPTNFGEFNEIVCNAIQRKPEFLEDGLQISVIVSKFVVVNLVISFDESPLGIGVPLMLRPEIIDKIVRVTMDEVLPLPPEAKRVCGIYKAEGVVGQLTWRHDDPGKGCYVFRGMSTGEPSRNHPERVHGLYLDIMRDIANSRTVFRARSALR